jgi:uncharacterized membrane protein
MPTTRSYRYWGLVIAVTLWLILILIAPWMRSLEIEGSGLIYLAFSKICHQQTERCYYFLGQPLVVCARCTGLYFGFWLGLLLIPHLKALRDGLANRPRLILVFLLPMAIDLFFPDLNSHRSRFITGLLASFPISVFVWWGLEQIRGPAIKRSHI